MYKLIAKQSNGVTFITNSSQINDLQRIAAGLQHMVSYRIELNGSIVWSQSHTLRG